VGTTYAYDFLGLIEKALVADWQAAIADGRASAIPTLVRSPLRRDAHEQHAPARVARL
jgi:hypothetical protein